MQIFYHPGISLEKPDGALDAEESKHIVKSMRLKTGDPLYLTDGKGKLFMARLTDGNPRAAQFKVLELSQSETQKNYRVHIAVAPTKNADRMEWFVEKAVEMGIDEISFLLTRHSEKENIRMERLQKIALSAMKQSLKFSIPQLNAPVGFAEFLSANRDASRFMAYTRAEDATNTLFNLAGKGQNYCVMIGPEGGFSEQEAASAEKKGWKLCSLGPSRLRTETAAMVSCAALNILNGG